MSIIIIIRKGSQHGFRPTRGRSCLISMTDLLEFFEEVYERIAEGKLRDIHVIYLDFATEFDKVV